MKLVQYILSVGLVVLACSACSAQREPPFDHEKAKALTPERRAQLDLAFFNDYVTGSSGGASTLGRRDALLRKERIHALAEEGFEIAYIAEQIFDFQWGKRQRSNANVEKWLSRVQQLADTGDASALCFIWMAEFNIDNGRGNDEIPSPTRFAALKRAAMMGHPHCMGDWGNWRYYSDLWPKDPIRRAEWYLKSAEKGCIDCQDRMASLYLTGNGVPKDIGKAWCWITEAVEHTDNPSVFSTMQIISFGIWNPVDINTFPVPRPRPHLTLYRPGTNCQEVQQLDSPFEPEPLQQRVIDANNAFMKGNTP